ncbi:MAG: hypothetical protein AAFR30_11910, partial [Cyanobacteria bacterium J06628_4]
GTLKYFNSKGRLTANYQAFNRAIDGFVGLLKSLFEAGFDLISDHNMSYYISYLDKAMEAEYKDKKATNLEEDMNRVGGVAKAQRIQKK